jgi:hypothetical protein
VYWKLLIRFCSTDGKLVRGNSCHRLINFDLLITSFFLFILGTVKSCINPGSWSPGRYSACSHHTRRNTDALFSRTARFVFCMCIIEMKRLHFCSEIKQKYENAKGTANVPDTHDHEEGLHSVIGLALVLGFVFMLLIDQIGTSKSRGK